MMERSKVAGTSGEGPPAFVPFSETTRKKHHTVNPSGEPRNSKANAPEKPSNLPNQDVKTSTKQTDKPKAHQHHTYKATSHRQADGDKPQQQHHHHQRKPHQRERYQDRPFHGQPSKQRTYNPHHKQSKGQTNEKSMRSQGQSLSDYLPVTFNNSEEHFPALSYPTSHPQPSSITTRDEHQPPPPPRPMLAWDTTTGGSIPFGAKRKT